MLLFVINMILLYWKLIQNRRMLTSSLTTPTVHTCKYMYKCTFTCAFHAEAHLLP